MCRKPVTMLAVVLTLAFVAAGPASRGGDAGDDARAIAVKVTTAGAAMFEARDAKGLAMTYTDDARLEIISKEKDSSTVKTEVKTGRAEIQAYYEEVFKGGGTVHSRNTVEHARRIEPGLLTISGIFEPNTDSAEPLKLPFIQVRVKQGDAWKIVNLQLFVMPQK